MAGYIDHVIPWRLQFSLRAGFCRPFSSFSLGVFLLCERFVTVVVDFANFSLFFLSVSSKVWSTCLATRWTASRLRLTRPFPRRLRVMNPPPQPHQIPLQMLAAFRENGAPNSTSGTSGNSSAASFATSVPSTYTSTSTACRSSSLAGSVTVPSFLSTYSSVGIPVLPRASQPPVPALSAPSLYDYSLVPSTSSPTLAPSVGKAFVVGPGYAPIPGKLVAKITSGAFVELADLLAENIRVQEADPHTYLDGKLLVAPAKKRVVEITDILTWIQAFTIYQWIFCSTYPSRWQDTTQYKLLILQTASQFPGPSWLNYDTAFRKHAAASLLADWSKINLDLYNFHTRASSTVTGQSAPHSTSLPHTSASSNVPPKRSFDPIQYCRSWNDGACRWSLRQRRYRHVCERCDGQHPLTNCPFRPYRGSQRSRSLTPSGGKRHRR